MVIIFQTLLMVIGMISGDKKDSDLFRNFGQKDFLFGRMSELSLVKLFVYCFPYAFFSLFLLGLMPVIFSLPNIGNKYEIVMLMIPYLLATSFFGLAASVFLHRFGDSVVNDRIFSVGLIFLSDILPVRTHAMVLEASHFIFRQLGHISFVKINSMGATIADIRQEYITFMDTMCRIFHFWPV